MFVTLHTSIKKGQQEPITPIFLNPTLAFPVWKGLTSYLLPPESIINLKTAVINYGGFSLIRKQILLELEKQLSLY